MEFLCLTTKLQEERCSGVPEQIHLENIKMTIHNMTTKKASELGDTNMITDNNKYLADNTTHSQLTEKPDESKSDDDAVNSDGHQLIDCEPGPGNGSNNSDGGSYRNIIEDVPITSISIGKDRRTLKDLKPLMESIESIGLLNPITVTKDNHLIAGLHRLKACEKLGWTSIPAVKLSLAKLNAELAQLDENLIRAELTALERSEQLLKRKSIYEALHPQAPTQPGRSKKNGAINASFSTDTANKTGAALRTIQQDIQIAKDIVPEVMELIRTLPLADSKNDLIKLSRLKPKEQQDVANSLLNGTPKTFPEALSKSGVHASHNNDNNERCTPPEIIEAVRKVLVQIDVDPASSAAANETVKAAKFYTTEDNSLKQAWTGRVFLNPPSVEPLITEFCDLLVQKFNDKEVQEAIVLVDNATETSWFQNLLTASVVVCFPKERIKFLNAQGKPKVPAQGQAILYFGDKYELFSNAFNSFGRVLFCQK